MQHTAAGMQQCIEKCLDCYWTCRQESMTHCLEAGGAHVAPEHFRLMINCAEICRTAADFMLSGSSLHARICAACAEVCEACAASCDALPDMVECTRTCRECAESCRTMAEGAAKAPSRQAQYFEQPDS